MKSVYILLEDGSVKTVFDNFVQFRKNTFHYILGVLVKEGKYETRLEAGKSLKKSFSDFYGKEHKKLVCDAREWEIVKIELNSLGEKKDDKENQTQCVSESYVTKFTKLKVIRGSREFRSLGTKLAYVKLEPLYGK